MAITTDNGVEGLLDRLYEPRTQLAKALQSEKHEKDFIQDVRRIRSALELANSLREELNLTMRLILICALIMAASLGVLAAYESVQFYRFARATTQTESPGADTVK